MILTRTLLAALLDVMTNPGSNGGIWIMTDYQDRVWPNGVVYYKNIRIKALD